MSMPWWHYWLYGIAFAIAWANAIAWEDRRRYFEWKEARAREHQEHMRDLEREEQEND